MAAVHSSGGTIGGTVFDPAGPLAARTTYGVTEHNLIFLYKNQALQILYLEHQVTFMYIKLHKNFMDKKTTKPTKI